MKNFNSWGIRIRKDLSKNYYSIWKNLETVRLDLGEIKPLEPSKAEFYDVGITERCNAMCSFCLEPGTKIQTNNGAKNIEDIKKGDLVYSMSNTGSIELKCVDQLFNREYSGDLIELETENGIIRLTPNHKVYTQNRGYVEVGNLQLSDNILS